MTAPVAGGVDCDLHPAVPHLTSLLPYLDDYWRDQVTTRGMTDLVSQSYPPNSPISARPDWRPARGKPGSRLEDMQAQALDAFGVRFGICNPLFGVQMVFSEDMQDAFCRALNDWLAREWLDKDERLRGSILIPTQSVDKSVAEIERCAKDARFVQVLMLVMGDMPLGKRAYWPIYAAAERLGFLSHRGLCRAGAGVSDAIDEPDRRGRVRAAPESENGDARKRLYLAAVLSLAPA